jgi:hypothetical protein
MLEQEQLLAELVAQAQLEQLVLLVRRVLLAQVRPQDHLAIQVQQEQLVIQEQQEQPELEQPAEQLALLILELQVMLDQLLQQQQAIQLKFIRIK